MAEIRWSSYLGISVIAVLSTFFFHELSHYLMGVALGYPMVMTLNSGYSLVGSTSADATLIDAAGPAFTIVQAVALFLVLRQFRIVYLYPALFAAFYLRLLASVVSLHNPNDESRIGAAIGIGPVLLPLIVSSLLFCLVYVVSRNLRLSRKLQFATTIVTVVISSLLIVADQIWHIQIFG
jgi:hypothetical protein